MTDKYRSGFVAIIGRPNVGKSTLMNAIIGEKLAIVSDKPQTTRNRIQCILNKENYQIIFIDTPGIHKPKNKLGEYMVNISHNTLSEVDLILFVVDVSDKLGTGDRYILDSLTKTKTPKILVGNKIDRLMETPLEDVLKEYQKYVEFDEIIGISALNKKKLDVLEKLIVSHMPEGPKYYPDDMITDQPEKVIVAELIREKALEVLQDEVPHGIGVEIISFKERQDKDLIDIHATIFCERKSHKGIIIGKNGKMLKSIGSKARKDIENLLGVNIYLELWVKIKEDWRNNASTIKSLGYE